MTLIGNKARQKFHLLLAVLFTSASLPFSGALADQGPTPDSTGSRRTSWEEDLKSPWTHAQTELWIGTGATLLLIILEDQVVDQVQAHGVEKRPLGRFANFLRLQGNLVPNAFYALGFGLHGWLGNDSRSTSKSFTMIEASLYAVLVSTSLKFVVREPRPDGSDRLSFPSGHSTAIGAFAGVVFAQENLGWGAAAGGLAGLVAYSRINDNRHFIHDVVAGLTIGTSIGLGLGRLHSVRGEEQKISFVPVLGSNKTAALQVAFPFQ